MSKFIEPEFNPVSCPKPTPPPPPSCVDLHAARQCVCTCCNCGKHKCVAAAQTSKHQSLNVKNTDARFQGATEYTSKYYSQSSHADRTCKDGISLKGVFPTGDYYPKWVGTEYSSRYNVEKPLVPGKAWVKAPLASEPLTFGGATTYAASYKEWGPNTRDAIRPRGFGFASKGPFQGSTLYSEQFVDKSEPVQPWRKLEHWPHRYSLCERHHPRRSTGPYEEGAEKARVVNLPPFDFVDRTTFRDHYPRPKPQESNRFMKPVRWGPKVEAFGGVSTHADAFRSPPDKEKCPVLMRPKPQATVNNHQCY